MFGSLSRWLSGLPGPARLLILGGGGAVVLVFLACCAFLGYSGIRGGVQGATSGLATSAALGATATARPTSAPATLAPTLPPGDTLEVNAQLTERPEAFGAAIGQGCRGDRVEVLASHQGSILRYYRVRIVGTVGECPGRSPVGAEGWTLATNVNEPLIAASVPTTTPIPPTPTPVPPTPTPTAGPEQQTATAVAFDAGYPELDVRELVKAPDRYQGQRVRLTGEVFRIEESGGQTVLQMWVSYPGAARLDREAVLVRFDGILPGVYENSAVIVYGVGAGVAEGTNAFGATVRQPIVEAARIRY